MVFVLLNVDCLEFYESLNGCNFPAFFHKSKSSLISANLTLLCKCVSRIQLRYIILPFDFYLYLDLNVRMSISCHTCSSGHLDLTAILRMTSHLEHLLWTSAAIRDRRKLIVHYNASGNLSLIYAFNYLSKTNQSLDKVSS